MTKDSNQAFKAGSAQVDITPVLGSRIGVDMFAHYARFIHDPLFAKALVLESGGCQIAMVVVDICIMPSDLLAEIKSAITERTGIPVDHIMLSCTHTHGGGDVAGFFGGGVDMAYRRSLPQLIAASVEQAGLKKREAKLAFGSVAIPQHVCCRRYLMMDEFDPINPISGAREKVKMNPVGVEHLIERPAANPDPELCFFGVKDLDDNWISVVGNYGLHYVGDWDVDTVTADFYGAFGRQLKSKLNAPEDFVGIMTHGTAGDVNIWDFMHPGRYPTEHHAKTELIANDLTDGVVNALKNTLWLENPVLRIAYEEMELGMRKPSNKTLEMAKNRLAASDFENLQLDTHGLEMMYAREQLLLNEYPEKHTAAIMAIRIGDVYIGTLGGEFFAETGHWLKEQMQSKNYFTICLANTYDGYVAPEHEFENGGYETWPARTSFLEAKAEGLMREKLRELITNV